MSEINNLTVIVGIYLAMGMLLGFLVRKGWKGDTGYTAYLVVTILFWPLLAIPFVRGLIDGFRDLR